jgi:hypothetical protein
LRHYYAEGQLPRITREEQNVLVTLARCGDYDARLQLIESKLGDAVSIGMRIGKKIANPQDAVELALYHLPRCVDSFLRNYHPNLDAYVTFVISREVQRSSFEESRTICMTYQTAWRHRKAGVFDNLNFNVESYDYNREDSDLLDTLVTRMSPRIANRLIVDQSPDSDLRDVITKVVTESDNPEESKRIIEYRILGFTDKEVANTIDKSVSYVATRRVALLHSIKVELES